MWFLNFFDWQLCSKSAVYVVPAHTFLTSYLSIGLHLLPFYVYSAVLTVNPFSFLCLILLEKKGLSQNAHFFSLYFSRCLLPLRSVPLLRGALEELFLRHVPSGIVSDGGSCSELSTSFQQFCYEFMLVKTCISHWLAGWNFRILFRANLTDDVNALSEWWVSLLDS